MAISRTQGKEAQQERGLALRGAWDMDDVLIVMKSAVLRRADDMYGISAQLGRQVTLDDITEYRIQDNFKDLVTTEQIRFVIEEYYRSPERIEPSHPKLSSIVESNAAFATLDVVSASIASDGTIPRILESLAISTHFERIIQVGGSSEKAKLPGYDFCVEDHGGVAVDFASSGRLAILVRRPWNYKVQKTAEETPGSRILLVGDVSQAESALLANLGRMKRG